MPINYKEYPPNWAEIRARILERAGNRCEKCGALNYDMRGKTRVILTIAHLDHDHKNWEVKDERLMAMCQGCHLGYDAARHARKRKYGMECDGKQQMKIEF